MIEITYCNVGNLGNYVRLRPGKIVHCDSIPGDVNAYYTQRGEESYNPYGTKPSNGELLAFELIPGQHPSLSAFRTSDAFRQLPEETKTEVIERWDEITKGHDW